ncbi:MAG: methyltransferase [Parafilimonas sp.]|nr:methyltransferase [Parafilimonas sp.]
MKVCTDACLFGAWAANSIQNSKVKIKNCLDIGIGTGLLSLMLAQKLNNAKIDAVEIDEAAAQQAKENFEASAWKERLNVYNLAIQQFVNSAIRQFKYDVIISNPPFYENDLKSNDTKRNIALHSAELKLDVLLQVADELLNDEGLFFLLLPFHRLSEFEILMNEIFFIREKALVKQTTKHDYFRCMLMLTKKSTTSSQSEIIILKEKNEYTDDFKNLLNDYYLYL